MPPPGDPAPDDPRWVPVVRPFGALGALLLIELGLAALTGLWLGFHPHALDRLPGWERLLFAFGPLVALLATVAVAARAGGMWMCAGQDGFSIRTRAGERFISYAEVAHIRAPLEAVFRGARFAVVTLRSGEAVVVRGTGGERGDDRETKDRAARAVDALVDALVEGQAAYRARERRRPAPALPRRFREIRGWLRAMEAPGAAFRSAALDRDELLRVAEDPRAPQVARAAAGAALRGGLAESERSRLRVAAAHVAAPRVRVVLEAVTDDSAEATDAALAALEREA